MTALVQMFGKPLGCGLGAADDGMVVGRDHHDPRRCIRWQGREYSNRPAGSGCRVHRVALELYILYNTRMPTGDYRRALDAAVREYETALAERVTLERRLAQLQQTIGTLSRLCGLVPTVQWGLTDACRLVLRSAGEPVTAVQVRDRLAAIGFDLDRYANPLASIHVVLKRLAESGEARTRRANAERRVAYEGLESGRLRDSLRPAPARRRRAGR